MSRPPDRKAGARRAVAQSWRRTGDRSARTAFACAVALEARRRRLREQFDDSEVQAGLDAMPPLTDTERAATSAPLKPSAARVDGAA
jgi:hypothetical protein